MFKTKDWTYRLLAVLLSLIVLTVLLHVLVQTINYFQYPASQGFVELSNRFDLDDEASIPTWVSQLLLGGAALLAMIVGRMAQGAQRKSWYVIAMLAALASLDEVARLHELVVQTLHVRLFGLEATTLIKNAWLILAPLIMLAGLGLLYILSKALPRRTIKLLVLAGGIFISGALGVEILSSGMNTYGFAYTVLVTALEEGLELIGSAVLVYAIADYMNGQFPKQTQQILSTLHIKP